MTENAVRIQAALGDGEKTETEIAVETGLSLAETGLALGELRILGVAVEDEDGPISRWRLLGVAV